MAKFRTSARTVDMLGRQQIAGIPTAISELFKNAHDAYATRVEADFYRPEQLLVLRDNGLGMTLEDVIDRWLVLGTHSKVDGGKDMTEVAVSLGMQERPPTGEKGIGRLAIGAIGPQVLLVTRARRSDGLHPTVASFVNWSLFALPGISLDEIEVPVREFHNGELPTATDVAEMVEAVRHNLERLSHMGNQKKKVIAEITRNLDRASLDVAYLQRRFDAAALKDSASGTQFYIQPTNPMLEISLDAPVEKRQIGGLQKTLMGFTNTMMPDRPRPVIATAFRDHKSLDLFDSVIGPESFFTSEEFIEADHHIEGEFDEYGQFSGTVAVYGGKQEKHLITWPEARGKQTLCGPFSINFAYVQGIAHESRMPRERWNRIIWKLNRMGGLYIYRNGIRILPYGSTDNDFLGIEERRTLGAAYYYFSARRMFGAIELPVASSARLIEKAGREGFRDNRAYRQFREILIHFLVQLAADYFRDDSSLGAYSIRKADLDRRAKALERQSQQALVRRRELTKALEACAAKLNSPELQEEIGATITRLKQMLEAVSLQSRPDAKLRLILEAERVARTQLAALRLELRVPYPRGFALSTALRHNLAAYRVEYAKFESDVLAPAQAAIEDIVSETTRGLDTSRRRRFDAAAEDAWRTAKQKVTARSQASREQLSETSKQVTNAVRRTMAALESELNEISQRVQRADVSNLTDAEIVQLRLDFDAEIEAIASTKEAQLEAITEQLQVIVVDPDDSGQIITEVDVAGAVEEKIRALQERADADLELTQIGMAIEIIDHEFQATIRSVRNHLQRFRAWADVNQQLADVYHGIRVSFEHLDGYLTLFTPLHRRLYRAEVEIRGRDISRFLLDLFKERLTRHQVEVSVTQAFRRHTFRGYPSTFYPVFVNLLDNAVFWLRDQNPPRIIHLDVKDDAMIVADSGPGVPLEDREAIFELGFTRKPGGRGLGLYISRDVLDRAGYELTIGESHYSVGAEFRIQPKPEDRHE
ncbi:MAG: ATP-binding protein [Caldilineaceae bacterium]|nr:ATP-binding protein [Caldilineaceae bacterium]